jgi:ubiquitin-protein ligase
MYKKFKESTKMKSMTIALFTEYVSKINGLDNLNVISYAETFKIIQDFALNSLTGFSFEKIVELVKELKLNKKHFKILNEDKNHEDDDKINKYIKSINEYFTNKLQDIVEEVSKKRIISNIYNDYRDTFENRVFSIESEIAGENNYYYKKNLKNILPNKKYIRRMQKEWSILYELPIHYNSSIFARADQNHVSCMKVMITGPDDTPYDSGIFIFDVLIPSDYPMNAPKVIFKNTGGKRFNPNLYNCGKVCLSLLGTWSGDSNEKWIPSESTLNQIFISIQSQIFIKEPYFNEPGYEREMNTTEGKKKSINYNKRIRVYTMEHAIKDMLKNPETVFKNEIIDHFKLKKDYINKFLKDWLFSEHLSSTEKKRYMNLSNEINTLLNNLG